MGFFLWRELSVMNLFFQSRQPSILLSSSGLLMAAHSLKKTNFLLLHDNVPSNAILSVKQIPVF
jgi:hypothetical protein